MNARPYIVTAGGANFGSLREALRRLGVEADIGDDVQRMRAATHLILPGVGAAAPAMQALRERGLDRVLARLTQPLLGICLGMQLLFERSDETSSGTAVECLGLLHGGVHRLSAAPGWPHMGWNRIAPGRTPHALLDGIGSDDWFYFVHGYAASGGACTIAHAEHGAPFAAAVAAGNIHGVQFHPEKSATAGRRLLANFLALA